MKNNLFNFATSELSQDAFICWCLNWCNDPDEPLNPMARELLALMGEKELARDQKITISRQVKHIDVLVVLKGLNRAIIIEDKTTSSEHDDQISRYQEIIKDLSLDEKKELGIDNAPVIRTVFFKTGFHYDYDLATVADCKIDAFAFLSVLEKYEHQSDILDDYIEHLRESIEWYEIYGKYDENDENGNWNISEHYVAQHKFMKDMLRERFPQPMWVKDFDIYRITNGSNVGGRPWTELTFLYCSHPVSSDKYYLFWRVDTDNKGPYVSLRFYEKFDKKDDAKRARHVQVYEHFRQLVQEWIENHPEIGLTWDAVKGGYTGNYYESSILTICLENSLRDWANQHDIVKQQILAITEFFINMPELDKFIQ